MKRGLYLSLILSIVLASGSLGFLWLDTQIDNSAPLLQPAPMCEHYPHFFQVRYSSTHGTIPPLPLNEVELTVGNRFEELPNYRYISITNIHGHSLIPRSSAEAVTFMLSGAELDAFYPNGDELINKSKLQVADIQKIHLELFPEDTSFENLSYGVLLDANGDPLYDSEGNPIPDSSLEDYQNGRTIVYPVLYTSGNRFWFNYNTPAVMEYAIRASLDQQAKSTFDSYLFYDNFMSNDGQFRDAPENYAFDGTQEEQMLHVSQQMIALLREVKTRADENGDFNEGILLNGHRYGRQGNEVFLEELLKPENEMVFDGMMIENAFYEDGTISDVEYFLDLTTQFESLNKKALYTVSVNPELTYDSEFVNKTWLLTHLLANDVSYLFMNNLYIEPMFDFAVYSEPLGDPLEDPYKIGSVWYRQYERGQIQFDTSFDSLEGVSFVANNAAEMCDGLDNDCDGEIDEGDACLSGSCGDSICTLDENFESCPLDCRCTGSECFSQNVRIKTAYTYDSSASTDSLDELLSHGVNAFIVKNCLSNAIDYSAYDDGVPNCVRDEAAYARQNGVLFFPAINFVHRTTTSPFTTTNVVYSDGEEGEHVSPFDEIYWDHLTDVAVSLATLSVNYPDVYKVDGIFFDFELYGNTENGEPTTFDPTWGFEDSTFANFISIHGGGSITPPPVSSDQKALRYDWLVSEGLLDDYYDYLRSLITSYASDMRLAVKAANPDFLIGAYPSPEPESPRWMYLENIFDGWSTSDEPAVVWGTETYVRGGPDELPENLDIYQMSGNLFNLTDVYTGSQSALVHDGIYAYYVPGVISNYYFSGDWAYHLYNIAKETNGYWIWTTHMFTQPFDQLIEGYLVYCYDEIENSISVCQTAQDYAAEVDNYYSQMNVAEEELRAYLADNSYVSSLSKITPPPVFYSPVNDMSFPRHDFAPLKEGAGSPLSLQPLTFRESHQFVLRAEAGQHVSFDILNIPVTSLYEYTNGMTYRIIDRDNMVVSEGTIHANVLEPLSFTAPYTGAYYLITNPLNGRFEIHNTNVSIVGYNNPDVHIMSESDFLYFWVDVVDRFTLNMQGQGSGEGARISVYGSKSEGYPLIDSASTSTTSPTVSLEVAVPEEMQNQIWRLAFSPSPPQTFEDVHFQIEGLHGIIGLTDNESYFLIPISSCGNEYCEFWEDHGSCSLDCPLASNNNNGGGGGGGGGNQIIASCEPEWICDDWGDCLDGVQRRECYDAEECTLETNKPSEIQSCGGSFIDLTDQERLSDQESEAEGGFGATSLNISAEKRTILRGLARFIAISSLLALFVIAFLLLRERHH